VMVSL